MANILLGCDEHSVSYDKKSQKVVKKILEKAGHKVEVLNVGPNYTQTAMGKKSSKGKIAIYMVNGADLQTYKDFAQGVKQGYYHVKYCYFGLQGYLNKETCTCKGAKTAKLKRAHDDESPKSYTQELIGMTTAEVCEKYKAQIAYACGSTREELGNNLVKVIGGGSNSSSKSSKTDTGSTIKEALKKVVNKWDGEVEINLRGDTVYVNKIKNPTSTKLVINEYDNIIYDSITATDVNPSTVNTLILNYKDYELKLTDDALIKRFGVIKKTISAPTTIKTLESAKGYLNREWNKIRRNNGRQVELKVPGHIKWQTGKWARTYIPSLFIDDYMYISKSSHEEDGSSNWLTSLTLVDYPPSFKEAAA